MLVSILVVDGGGNTTSSRTYALRVQMASTEYGGWWLLLRLPRAEKGVQGCNQSRCCRVLNGQFRYLAFVQPLGHCPLGSRALKMIGRRHKFSGL